MELLDTTILYVCFVPIAQEFGVDVSRMSLPVLSYVVGTCVLIPMVAWLSQRVNMINAIMVALALFSLSSLACGLAPDIALFALFRFFQGVTVSVAGAIGVAAILSVLDNREIVTTMGFINIPALVGTALGPFVGALFSFYMSWRVAFIINFPVGILLLFLLLNVRSNSAFNPPANLMRDKLDWVGLVLISLFLIVTSIGFEQLSKSIALSGLLYVMFGLLFCVGYVILWKLRQREKNDDSILDLRVFDNQDFSFGILVNIFARTAMCGVPVLLGVMLQRIYGFTIIKAGWYLAVIAVAGIIAKFLSSYIERIGVSRTITFSSIATAFAILLMSQHAYWVRSGYLWLLCLMLGFAMSLLYTSMNAVMYLSLEKKQLANASNIGTIIQQLGIGLGVLVAMGGFQMFLVESASPLSMVYLQSYAFEHTCFLLAVIMIFGLLVAMFFEYFLYRKNMTVTRFVIAKLLFRRIDSITIARVDDGLL